MAAKRLTMRQLREILRLKLGCGLPQRAVATAVKAGKGTVSEYLGLARAAGVGWPIPEELASDEALEARVFGVKAEAQSDRAAVDAPLVHAELRRPGVTLSLLWQEDLEANSRGCKRLSPVMRRCTWRARRSSGARLGDAPMPAVFLCRTRSVASGARDDPEWDAVGILKVGGGRGEKIELTD